MFYFNRENFGEGGENREAQERRDTGTDGDVAKQGSFTGNTHMIPEVVKLRRFDGCEALEVTEA